MTYNNGSFNDRVMSVLQGLPVKMLTKYRIRQDNIKKKKKEQQNNKA